jgi:NitT/TauT family transport system substrate-binding protein
MNTGGAYRRGNYRTRINAHGWRFSRAVSAGSFSRKRIVMRRIIVAGVTAAGLLAAGCTSPAPAAHHGVGAAPAAARRAMATAPVGPPGVQASGVLRLGLTEDVTDAPALAGWQMGIFGQDLGKVTFEPVPYTSTAQEVTALEEGQLDAAYLDPVAAVQAWQSAPGGLIKIIAGTASGGAELVAAPSITSPAQLKGQHVGAPAGGAQEAAADYWLHQQGLPPLTDAGASPDAGVLQDFTTGKIAAAWEPPPLDVQLVAAGGHVLLNEATQWTGGQFPTAVLVVTQRYLTANPDAVTALLQAHVQSEKVLAASQASAQAAIEQRLTAIGNPLPDAILGQSLAQLTFTNDPLATPLLTEAQHAATADLLNPVTTLNAIYDLTPLNQVLTADGQPAVST